MGIEELLNNPIVQSPWALVDLGPFCCVVWQGEAPALCGALRAVGVCPWAPMQLLRALGMGWGLSPAVVPPCETRLSSRLLCCSPGRATAPLWVWGAPAQTKHRAVCDNWKRTLGQFCQARPCSCAQTGDKACDLGFLGSWWSIVCSLETASTQPSPLLCWNYWGEDLEESWGSWKCWRAVWHSEKLCSSPDSLSMLPWCGNYRLHVTSTWLLHPTALLAVCLSVLLSGKKKVTALFHLPQGIWGLSLAFVKFLVTGKLPVKRRNVCFACFTWMLSLTFL